MGTPQSYSIRRRARNWIQCDGLTTIQLSFLQRQLRLTVSLELRRKRTGPEKVALNSRTFLCDIGQICQMFAQHIAQYRWRQKIGIVGRTGSGKSTLATALFWMVEKLGSSILIDGVDISTRNSPTLRSRITIVPQSPILFEEACYI